MPQKIRGRQQQPQPGSYAFKITNTVSMTTKFQSPSHTPKLMRKNENLNTKPAGIHKQKQCSVTKRFNEAMKCQLKLYSSSHTHLKLQHEEDHCTKTLHVEVGEDGDRNPDGDK